MSDTYYSYWTTLISIRVGLTWPVFNKPATSLTVDSSKVEIEVGCRWRAEDKL